MNKNIFCIISLSLMTALGNAQNFEQPYKPTDPFSRVAPQEVPHERPQINLPDVKSERLMPGGDQVILRSLKGIVIFGSPNDAKNTNVKNMTGVQVINNELASSDPELINMYNSNFIGKALTRDSLNQLILDTIQHFRKRDMPLVDAYTPEQDITDGVLKIIVINSRLGEVKVKGNRYFSTKSLMGYIRYKPNDYIRSTTLINDLSWINENPFRSVDAIYEPGSTEGTTDIVLMTRDRNPWRFYSGVEDTGTPNTGNWRWFAGFNWGNVWGLSHELSYQYTTDTFFEYTESHSMSYLVPLPWHHKLNLFGSYGTSNPDVGPFFRLDGESYSASMRYIIPIGNLTGNFLHEFVVGLDYKFSNSDLFFGEFVQTTPQEVAQTVWGYNAGLTDEYGRTSLRTQLFWQPGGIADYDNTFYYQTPTTGINQEYVYGNVSLTRLTKIGKADDDNPWNSIARVSWQGTTSNLPGTEKFGAGGYASVRGYAEGAVTGDQGVSGSIELRTPSVSPGDFLEFNRASDRLVFLAFLDAAHVEIHEFMASTVPPRSSFDLMSAGAGLRYTVGSNFSLRFDYGWQLLNPMTGPVSDPGQRMYQSRGHVGCVISF